MKVLLSMALAIFTLSSFGQSDQKLEAMFSKEQIKNLASDSPGTLEFWSYVAEEGLTLQSVPEGKNDDLSNLESITIDLNFNLLEHVELIEGQRKYFLDTVSGQLVILKSMEQLRVGFNQMRSKS
jgi:hypothetical protein